MGWSCNAAAAIALDQVTQMCIKSTGSSNTWEHGRNKYFYEPSRVEHDDGAITGSVFKFLDDGRCRKVGSFRINGDGVVERFPTMASGVRMNYTLKGAKLFKERYGQYANAGGASE